jgi:competence protein ComEA
MKNKIILGILSILGLSIIIFFIVNKDVDAQTEDIVKEEIVESNSNKESNSTKIMVDIKGAVKKPGVYEVNSNYRVIDVIKKAGGLNSNANTNYINLSSKVSDEMVIWIYTKNEIDKLKLEQSSTKYMIESCNCPVVDNTTCLNSNNNTSNKKDTNSKLVNINIASLEELLSITGIGESKAKSIIDYRTKNGNFKSKEDIMNVSGIGEKFFEQIKNNITV